MQEQMPNSKTQKSFDELVLESAENLRRKRPQLLHKISEILHEIGWTGQEVLTDAQTPLPSPSKLTHAFQSSEAGFVPQDSPEQPVPSSATE